MGWWSGETLGCPAAEESCVSRSGWASGQKGPSVQQNGHCTHSFGAEGARSASVCSSLRSVKWVCDFPWLPWEAA